VVGDLDSGARFAFDDFPTAGAAPGRRTARTAAWSAAGQWTAWALTGDDDADPGPGERSEPSELGEIRLHLEDTDTNRIVARALTAFYLCPSPCGRYLSHLSPGPLGLELAITDLRTGALQIAERGQPLFWSWSPDARRVAVHVADRVLIVPVDGGTPETVSDAAGSFIVPWWRPDGSVVFVEGDRLVTFGPDATTTGLGVAAGTGRFALDPDGRRVAVLHTDGERSSLVVSDLLTGERDTVTDEPTAGFFWSPDARRLAAVVPGGSGRLQWIVSDGRTVERLAPFRPSILWLRDVLPFFEQYTQSHAQWSADSRCLVAPAVDVTGSTLAIVQAVGGANTVEHLSGARLAWWAD